MTTRRELLLGTAGLMASLGLPSLGRAGNLTPCAPKFVFYFAVGGWDPTRVFAPMFHAPDVDTEVEATTAMAGGISFVDHPARPSVRRFFEHWGDRSVVLNGMLVRSVNHAVCRHLVMTGKSAGLDPDWPVLIAAASADQYNVPNLVISGPTFPGPHGVYTAQTGESDQLMSLLTGAALQQGVSPAIGLGSAGEGLLDAYIGERVAVRRAQALSSDEQRVLDVLSESHERMGLLKKDSEFVDLTVPGNPTEATGLIVDVLAAGMSRCVTFSSEGWDTHSENELQSGFFEGSFSALDSLMNLLASTPGEVCPTLADETVVVAISEMGRTPYLNGTAGKDHWPYTSVLMVGPGLSGGRVVGGYDEFLNGSALDPATGETAANGLVVTPTDLGATLVQLAGLDPKELVPGGTSLTGILTG